MARLFHITVVDLIASVARRLKRARVYFGHGTDNASDEAAALVLHALKLPYDAPVRVLKRRVTAGQREKERDLLFVGMSAWLVAFPASRLALDPEGRAGTGGQALDDDELDDDELDDDELDDQVEEPTA